MELEIPMVMVMDTSLVMVMVMVTDIMKVDMLINLHFSILPNHT